VRQLLIVGLLLAAGNPVMAQPVDKIRLFVEARSEGQGSRDQSATRLLAAVRGGLEAVRDVEMVPRDLAHSGHVRRFRDGHGALRS
jgi:hypothetical protein